MLRLGSGEFRAARYWLAVGSLILLAPAYAEAATCTSVSNTTHGTTITFTFDQAYECGRFANGYDWWVKTPSPGGSVTIVSISPSASGGRHGFMVNPGAGGSQTQAFDSRADVYSSSARPGLPLDASGGTSVVKAYSASSTCGDTNRSFVQSYAVLTVLDTTPPGNGSTVFRPPYVGSSKPLYSVSDLRLDLVPTLDPSLVQTHYGHSNAEERFDPPHNVVQRPIDAQKINACRYQNDYGGRVARWYADAMVDLMFGETDAEKTDAVISAVQVGIDLSHSVQEGNSFDDGGAQGNGRKILAAFAAALLESDTLADPVRNPVSGKVWHEDAHTYRGKNGVALYGRNTSSCGSKTRFDQFQYIDGDEAYLRCCHWSSWMFSSLVLKLMPSVAETWGHPEFAEYMDRRYNQGIFSSPDPAASSRGGTCYNFGHSHGNDVGFSSSPVAYESKQTTQAWNATYECAPNCPSVGGPPAAPPLAAPVMLTD